MPKTRIVFFQEDDTVPVLEWLDRVRRNEKKAAEKCIALLRLLAESGHELHRPYVDYLRDGIYELRISFRRVQYRILYFFHGQNVVIVTNGLTKESKVPKQEIDLAIERKKKFENEPDLHSYSEGGIGDEH